MLLRIDHETKLTYTDSVIESVMELKMAPPSTEDQTVLGYKLRIAPSVPITIYRDGFGNRTEVFNLLQPHQEIIMRASSCVRIHRRPLERLNGLVSGTESPSLEALEFLRFSPLTQPTPELREFVHSLPKPHGPMKEVIESLIHSVRGRLQYEKKVTDANTPVGEVLKLGQGVCQDFAHLFIATARSLGLPARYVSGYVNQPGEIATHAWCQIWASTSVGWVDVDPTQGKWVENNHVLVAIGRDYSDVPPNRGVWKGAEAKETISVTVTVTPVDQLPSDLTELTAPAWTNVPLREGVLQQNRTGFNQQSRRKQYRQQQSQQQQESERVKG